MKVLLDTFTYRTSKFIQRNKLGAAAAAFILLTLVAGIIATAWEAHKARVQSARAEQRFNEGVPRTAMGLASPPPFRYDPEAAALSFPIRSETELVLDLGRPAGAASWRRR